MRVICATLSRLKDMYKFLEVILDLLGVVHDPVAVQSCSWFGRDTRSARLGQAHDSVEMCITPKARARRACVHGLIRVHTVVMVWTHGSVAT